MDAKAKERSREARNKRRRDELFERRKEELLAECKVSANVFCGVLERLQSFLDPFVELYFRGEPCSHAVTYVGGLVSDLDRKNIESIAYRFGQRREALQRFIGWAEWEDGPMRLELARQVGEELGEEHGVIVFDPSGFPKSGRESVGVARQWCGRLGKVDNCQVAIYMGYVSSEENTLVDMRLYLPKEWTEDKKRLCKAHVPVEHQGYRTRHQLCLEMLNEKGRLLPHSWIAGDDEMGRPYWFRRRLDRMEERYLLAVPSNTLIRDLNQDPPPYDGHGRRPNRPWQRVDKWTQAQSQDAWTRIEVRDGTKGPLVVEALKTRVVARTPHRQEGHEEVLVVIRWRDRDNDEVTKTDFYLSNADADVSLHEFARVAKAEHRIEECIQRGKSEAGLADYEVRNWIGWHHHQTLSLLAVWFLTTETRRGKKNNSRDHAAADPGRHRSRDLRGKRLRRHVSRRTRTRKATRT